MSSVLKVIHLLLIFMFSFSNLFAADIPIIVIAPNGKAQSKSTVGTSVTIFDETNIGSSNDFFLGDVLGNGTTSFNYFQTGGHGATSGIQLRGLPKRYSTVYIDGVKQSDPSSVSDDFDFSHILKNQISRVEVLKGNQSSVYGSGAMGGTINITTKRGQPGFQKDINYNTGSHGTHNLALSISGADEKNDFYIGLERFITDGISTMNNNDESDAYENDTLVANYGYQFTDKLKFENNFRIANGFLEYDTEDDKTDVRQDDEEQQQSEFSASVALIYKPSQKFTNRLTYSKYSIERTYNLYTDVQDDFKGDRKSLTYFGNYNFNLDNSVVFGFDTEFDMMNYKQTSALPGFNKEGVTTNSIYTDYQKRFTKNLYGTLGARLDDHSLVGKEDSHRATLAYLFDDKATKLKSSYGTGFRFPSLYEAYYVYGAHTKVREGLKAETSKSFDIGIEKSFIDLGLNLDVSYFDIEYHDTLEGWKGTGSWNTNNFPGKVKSRGIELVSNWKKSDMLSFGLNYTLNATYDGAEQDDPDLNQNYTNDDLVRVPRQIINLQTNMKIPGYENLNLTLNTKWSDTARDYGNGNRTWRDEMLDDYLVNDLSIRYDLWNTYDLFFNITNVLNEKYETVRDYSQMDRSFNFGIKRSY